MRSPKERLERLVCGEHCGFFQPWREPPQCGGYRWLETRLDDEQLLENLERCRGAQPVLPLVNDRSLLKRLCEGCPYLTHGCAYRDPRRSGSARPCGALVATQLLLDRRMLCERDLSTPPRRAAVSA